MKKKTRKLAKEAGFIFWEDEECKPSEVSIPEWKPSGELIDWSCYYDDELVKFAKLVRADEREKCAEMVDHILKLGGGTYGDAIRSRSKK
jgi:hypothetical protein